MPSEWKATEKEKKNKTQRLNELRESLPAPREKTEPSELPGWVRTAFVYTDLEGKTYAEASEMFNRSPATLSNYASSLAAKKWRAALEEIANDPALMAKGILESAVAECAANLIWAIEAAKSVGDFKEVRVGSSALLDRLNIQKKEQPQAKPNIVINFSGASEPEIIEVESEVVEDAED